MTNPNDLTEKQEELLLSLPIKVEDAPQKAMNKLIALGLAVATEEELSVTDVGSRRIEKIKAKDNE